MSHPPPQARSPLRRTISAAKRRRGKLPPLSFGEQLADRVAEVVGSWRFILAQSGLLTLWVAGNALYGSGAWDPYPFILLNLLLSFQAAYTAPIIMMSQNRQSDADRDRARADYEVNLRAEAEIMRLHEKVDVLQAESLARVTRLLEEALARIAELEAKPRG